MKIISRKLFLVCFIIFLSPKGMFAYLSPLAEMQMENNEFYAKYIFYLEHSNDGELFKNPFFENDLTYLGGSPSVHAAPKFSFDYRNTIIVQYPNFYFKSTYDPSHFHPCFPVSQPQPFFCSMEYQIQNKLNFWIKFRAGTDADYMKSIKVYQQFDFH